MLRVRMLFSALILSVFACSEKAPVSGTFEGNSSPSARERSNTGYARYVSPAYLTAPGNAFSGSEYVLGLTGLATTTWCSDDPTAVAVHNDGQITAVRDGRTFVRAYTDEGGKIFFEVIVGGILIDIAWLEMHDVAAPFRLMVNGPGLGGEVGRRGQFVSTSARSIGSVVATRDLATVPPVQVQSIESTSDAFLVTANLLASGVISPSGFPSSVRLGVTDAGGCDPRLREPF